MTLRTDYNDALDTALLAARNEAVTYYGTTIFATIQADLAAEAAKGKKSFTKTYLAGGSVTGADLRLEGPLWEAYKTGVLSVMYDTTNGDLMFNDVVVNINTDDASTLNVDLVFTF